MTLPLDLPPPTPRPKPKPTASTAPVWRVKGGRHRRRLDAEGRLSHVALCGHARAARAWEQVAPEVWLPECRGCRRRAEEEASE